MKRYKARDGLVLTRVCGEQLLVSAGSLRGLCPFVTVLNETSAFLWEQLRNGATAEDLLRAVSEEYEVEDPTALRNMIGDFLRQMEELNYIIVKEPEQ